MVAENGLLQKDLSWEKALHASLSFCNLGRFVESLVLSTYLKKQACCLGSRGTNQVRRVESPVLTVHFRSA